MKKNVTDSCERKFVCDMLRAFIDKETNKAIVSELTLPKNINWNLLEAVAARNGLIAILQSMIDPSCIPMRHKEKWMRYSVQTLFSYTQSEKVAANFFGILNEEGIPAVAMRGMALSQWVYSDPIFRPMVDIDILVPSDVRYDFVANLEKHGLRCKRTLRSQFVYEIDNIKIEVHWSFLTPKRYRASANFDRWLDTRQEFVTKSGAIYCFSPENELLDLVCHAFIHHELDTLLKLTDIALVASYKNLDWGYINQWCEEASMTRLFAITLGLIDHLFGLSFLNNLTQKNTRSNYSVKFYKAYSARFFQTDTVTDLFRRKRALLYAAETIDIKIKQLIRFLSIDQFSELIKIAKA